MIKLIKKHNCTPALMSKLILSLSLSFSLTFCTLAHADISKGDAALAAGNTTQAIAFYQSQESDINAKIKLAAVYMAIDLDEAEDWIELARKQDDQDPKMHFTRGNIMGMQAANSIFSALSYAGKSLDSFEQAVALEPTNISYQMGLLSFYVQAPGIAGGDMDKAKQVAQAITALDPIEGLKANIMVYTALEDKPGLDRLLQEGLTKHSDDPWFLFNAGMIKQNHQEYAQAIGLLSQVPLDVENEEYQQRYFSAQYQIGKTAILAEDFYPVGLAALDNYIANAAIGNGMPSIHWATFRKANIVQAMGDKVTATQLYKSIQAKDDKQLKKALKKALKRLG
jgi:tetratricopeptide (TPR) repeat protein